MSGKHFEMVFLPRVKVSREDFFSSYPRYSAALDGFVNGPTELQASGPRIIWDHHEGCVRSVTLSTAKQVNRAIRTGLFEMFKRCGHPRIIAYMQDADEDCMLASVQLRHPSLANRRRLKDIVELNDLLDTVNGFFEVKKRWHLLKMLVWALQPYSEARSSGDLYVMDADAMYNMAEKIHERLRKMMYGHFKEVEPDTRHRIIERHGKFAAVEEIGRYARYELAKKGLTSFLSVVQRPDGRYQYTVARRSEFIVDRPILQDYAMLNELEGPTPNGDKWGGSTLGGGSPQKSGSRLDPDAVIALLRSSTDRIREKECDDNHH